MSIITFFKQYQTIIHSIGLFIAAGLQIIIAFGLLQVPRDVANAITFSVLSYILLDISQNTYNFKKNKAYEEQANMYRDIEKYIENRNVRNAILIQYSGSWSFQLIRALMNRGASVTLYIKNPETASTQRQKDRIRDRIQRLEQTLNVSIPARLTVYVYDVPATIKGVLVDDELLGIGWYKYEYINNENKKLDDDSSQDKFHLSGHNVAGMLCYKKSDEYDILKKMFMNQVENFKTYCELNDIEPILKLVTGFSNHVK